MAITEVTLHELVKANVGNALRGTEVEIRHYVRRGDSAQVGTLATVNTVEIGVTLPGLEDPRRVNSRRIGRLERDDVTGVITIFTVG